MHEMGHALVDILNLPTTGQEENVADQFATVMLLSDGTSGTLAAFAMAYVFDSGNDDYNLPWGTHSFDSQRFYNILCLTAGHHAGNNLGSDLIQLIPENRAVWCSEEYGDAVHAWDTLLTEHRP